MSAEELKRFYKARSKKPESFTYDNDGNLVELNKEGSVIKTITLPDYRPPTFEEFDEMEQKRLEEIAIANKDFEDARRELRDAISKPETPASDILRINRKIKEADIKLLNTRFPLRTILPESIKINQIDFTNPNEKRTYPYEIYFLKELPFTLQDQYVRIGKPAQKPLISVAEAKARTEEGQPVILFEEPETNDYGFMSLKWAVEIELNGTMYNSAQQALAAKLAKSFNDETGLQKIMIAETPDEVNYTLEDVPGDTEVNEAKWNDLTKQLIYDINLAKFSQYPELTTRLLETKNAILGAYIPNDTLIGIGVSLDNIQSKNPINWTGQNILGKALMDIREQIRSKRELAAQQAAVPQPTPYKKKPKVAPVIEGAIAAPVVEAPVVAPVAAPVVEAPVVAPVAAPVVEPPVVSATQESLPRPIRRRPKVASSAASLVPLEVATKLPAESVSQ